jgi:hypothetical protein
MPLVGRRSRRHQRPVCGFDQIPRIQAGPRDASARVNGAIASAEVLLCVVHARASDASTFPLLEVRVKSHHPCPGMAPAAMRHLEWSSSASREAGTALRTPCSWRDGSVGAEQMAVVGDLDGVADQAHPDDPTDVAVAHAVGGPGEADRTRALGRVGRKPPRSTSELRSTAPGNGFASFRNGHFGDVSQHSGSLSDAQRNATRCNVPRRFVPHDDFPAFALSIAA